MLNFMRGRETPDQRNDNPERGNETMTAAQKTEWSKRQDEVRRLVDAGGWQAIRQHSQLGPLWSAVLSESRKYVDAIFAAN
jgi:hypothetical protein